MNNYWVINILDLLESIGENGVAAIFSGFSCPKNQEIENFLRKNAIEFSKRAKKMISFLIFIRMTAIVLSCTENDFLKANIKNTCSC